MTAFFDSNIIVYSASPDDRRAEVAEQLLRRGGWISVQVLNEVASVAKRKMALTWPELTALLDDLQSGLRVLDLTSSVHRRGLALAERHGLAIYDAMIVAAALEAGCDTLYSEDMHDGLVVDGRLTVANPFA